MTRRSVDLPQPFGPMRATIPPPGIVRSMPSRTGSVPPVRVGKANDRSSRRMLPVAGRGRASRHVPSPSAPSGRRSGAVAG